MDEGVEMIDITIPSDDDALVFVQPSKQSFNLPAPSIAPARPTDRMHVISGETQEFIPAWPIMVTAALQGISNKICQRSAHRRTLAAFCRR